MDLAELTIEIDSRKAKTATADLKSFQGSAQTAKMAVDDLQAVSGTVFQQLEKDMNLIDNKSRVFENFDADTERIFAVESALNRLLSNGVNPNADAVQMLKREYTELSSSVPHANAGMKESAYLLQNIGYLAQDAPFALMSGNIAAVANNIPMVSSGFQRLIKTGGGLGGAFRMIGSTLMGPTGIVLALGTLLPSAIMLSQSGLLSFGDDVDDTDEKLDRLTSSIEQFATQSRGIGEISAFDPMGVSSSGEEIGQLRALQGEISILNNLQEERATIEKTVQGLISGGQGMTQASFDLLKDEIAGLDQVNTQIGLLEEKYGPLSEVRRQTITEMLEEQEAAQLLNQALIDLDPYLSALRDHNEELSPLLRDVELGLKGSEKALREQIGVYDEEIKRLRAKNNLTETEKDRLYAMIQAREKATSALTEEEKALKKFVEAIPPSDDMIDPFGMLEDVDTVQKYREELEGLLDIELDLGEELPLPGSIAAVRREISILRQEMERTADPTERMQYQQRIQELQDEMKLMTQAVTESLTLMDQIEGAVASMHSPVSRFVGDSLQEMIWFEERVVRVRNEFGRMEEKTLTLQDRLGEMFQGLLQDLTRVTTELLIVRPLMDEVFGRDHREGRVGGFLGDVLNWAGDAISRSGSGADTFEPKNEVELVQGVEPVHDVIVTNTGRVLKPHPKDTLLAMKDLSGFGGQAKSPVNVEVNVINETSSQVDVQQRRKPNGDVELVALVREVNKGLFNSGQMDRTMRDNYGVSRKGIQRG